MWLIASTKFKDWYNTKTLKGLSGLILRNNQSYNAAVLRNEIIPLYRYVKVVVDSIIAWGWLFRINGSSCYRKEILTQNLNFPVNLDDIDENKNNFLKNLKNCVFFMQY